MQRGGGGVCVLVFYGVVRFAIFSSCVLCCFAAWCGAHHRDAVTKKKIKRTIRTPTTCCFLISQLCKLLLVWWIKQHTLSTCEFSWFLWTKRCSFSGWKCCFGAACLCFFTWCLFLSSQTYCFHKVLTRRGELERRQRAVSVLSKKKKKKSNVPLACLFLLCYDYYYFWTLPFNQHRCVGKEDWSGKGKGNRTKKIKKKAMEAEKRETREKQKREVDWSRGG